MQGVPPALWCCRWASLLIVTSLIGVRSVSGFGAGYDDRVRCLLRPRPPRASLSIGGLSPIPRN